MESAEKLLRRVFIPIEHKTAFGTTFRTIDGEKYFRDGLSHVIRRTLPKVRGKAARRADKRARRVAVRQAKAA